VLLFADPCAQFYSTTAQAVSGLYSALSCSLATSGLPSGAIGTTAFQNVGNATVQTTQTAGPYFYGMRFIPAASITGGQNLFAWLDGIGSPQVTLVTNANGTIVAKRGGGNGTVLGTSSNTVVLTANVWCYAEFGIKCDGSTGTVDIKINGTSVLSLTGQNTQGQGTTTVGGAQILGANINNYVQDIYLADSTGSHNNTFLGDVHMSVYNPTSNGTYTAYTTNGAASLYQCVNAATPTDSTVFASDSTPGDRMSVNLASTSVAGTIAGVVNVGRMKKTDSGTRTAALTVTNNAVDSIGSTISLGTSYAYYTQISEVDVNTSLPWTNAGFNTVQLGVKTVS
jgi:hypothetical protein